MVVNGGGASRRFCGNNVGPGVRTCDSPHIILSSRDVPLSEVAYLITYLLLSRASNLTFQDAMVKTSSHPRETAEVEAALVVNEIPKLETMKIFHTEQLLTSIRPRRRMDSVQFMDYSGGILASRVARDWLLILLPPHRSTPGLSRVQAGAPVLSRSRSGH